MKRLVKWIFLGIAFFPWLWYSVFSRLTNRKDVFLGVSQLLSLFPGRSGCLLRGAFYRLALPGSSQDIVIEFLTTVSSPNAVFHSNVTTGAYCNIGWAEIGANCLIASGACILSGQNEHGFADRNTPIRLQKGKPEKVTIGDDCWIGVGAVIMADVGRGSVIGARSVVTRPIPPFSIAVGSPAKVIRSR